MNLFYIIIFLGLYACNSDKEFQYIGHFHKNNCVKGASFILLKQEKLRIGHKSSTDFNSVLKRLSDGKRVGFSPVSKDGCVSVYRFRFNGIIERVSSLTGYGNSEVHKVVQIEEFSFN